MPIIRVGWRVRVSAWLFRWRPLLPLFIAQLIVLIGFGALLPVLPLFVQEQGISATELGFIIAAWPIAKLMFEPVFGWWADRGARKPQMVAGLLILAAVSALPLFFTSFAGLFALRFIAGVATAMYDPAARGMVVDATDEDERGEAFGYYGAFHVGGFVIGPAIGGVGAALFAGYAFPFIFVAVLSLVGALILLRFLAVHPSRVVHLPAGHHPSPQGLPAGDPFTASEVALIPTDDASRTPRAPVSAVFNRRVIAALVLTFGLHLSFGTYEVVWSIYLIALGATVAWVGLTFVAFAIPVMIMSPIAGRLVDRRGPVAIVLVSGLVIIFSGAVYATAGGYLVPSVVVPIEAAATAAMTPALFAMLSRGAPAGRTSTAQGIFGATSTSALVMASLVAGALFERGIGLPFWFFVVGMFVCLVVGLLIYRSALPSVAMRAAPVAE
jgi:MFS transporter, DHA1 family, multidrug resistance protein